MVSETKLDNSFPINQFTIEGFAAPFREDRNAHGGGLIIYTREDIPCKRLKPHKLPNNVESIFIEIKVHSNKWLLVGGITQVKTASLIS